MHQVRGQRELLRVAEDGAGGCAEAEVRVAEDGAGGCAEAEVRVLSVTLSCISPLTARKV